MTLASLKPTRKQLVINLVREAGIDVSDWANSTRGPKGASTNPKYCYEWAFVEPGRVVVLNLWHGELVERDGVISHIGNFREARSKSSWTRRARKLDDALHLASRDRLPVRVVLNDGIRRLKDAPDAIPSKVTARTLDAEVWHVSHYDRASGAHILARGPMWPQFVDQFSTLEAGVDQTGRRTSVTSVYQRSADVRRTALARAKGRCEHCGALGFTTASGSIYLETHHILPLHQGGPDRVSNVIALCANHHREAHHGEISERLAASFLAAIGSSREGA